MNNNGNRSDAKIMPNTVPANSAKVKPVRQSTLTTVQKNPVPTNTGSNERAKTMTSAPTAYRDDSTRTIPAVGTSSTLRTVQKTPPMAPDGSRTYNFDDLSVARRQNAARPAAPANVPAKTRMQNTDTQVIPAIKRMTPPATGTGVQRTTQARQKNDELTPPSKLTAKPKSNASSAATSKAPARTASARNPSATRSSGSLDVPNKLTPKSAAGTRTTSRGGTSTKGGKKLNRPSHLDDRDTQDYENRSDIIGGTLGSVLKAVIYIVCVLAASAFLSIFGISVCNDVLAFVKDVNEVEVVIPEYASLSEVAKVLEDADVIEYPSIFSIYADKRSEKFGGLNFQSGSHTVSPSMSYDLLLPALIVKAPAVTTVSVTIPEGYTVDQIIALFVDEYKIGTREGFIAALTNKSWADEYWFVKEVYDRGVNEHRKYVLEGYLFPDTYYYYSNAKEETVLRKMLDNFEQKFEESMKDRCAELGYTVDQMITMASMIQMEARFPSEYPDVSSVFHNRLNNPSYETQGRLESDPTIMYVLEGHRTNLTQEEKDMDSPYNTYKYKGLPPSPISNPSLYAMTSALYPNETNYYYFYALKSHYHIFATTHAEHIQNILNANNGK